MANRSGQAYAYMAMTPVLPDAEDTLNAVIAGWGTGPASPLARLGTTHFARVMVLHDVIFEGHGQVRDSLTSPYLIFISNFDGDLEPYLQSILDLMPVEADAIWGCCVGWPGLDDRDRAMAYLLHNQIDTTFFVSAYADATVSDVLTALETRRKVAELAVAGQAMTAEELMAAWRERFAEVSL